MKPWDCVLLVCRGRRKTLLLTHKTAVKQGLRFPNSSCRWTKNKSITKTAVSSSDRETLEKSRSRRRVVVCNFFSPFLSSSYLLLLLLMMRGREWFTVPLLSFAPSSYSFIHHRSQSSFTLKVKKQSWFTFLFKSERKKDTQQELRSGWQQSVSVFKEKRKEKDNIAFSFGRSYLGIVIKWEEREDKTHGPGFQEKSFEI